MTLTTEIKFTQDQEQKYNDLSPDAKKVFTRKFKKRKKSTFITYLIYILVGMHYAYLKRWDKCFIYLITVGGLGFWMLWDLFTIPRKVREFNEDLVDNLLYEINKG